MPQRCKVCRHPNRDQINRELVAGGDIPTLAAFHGVSTDSLHRHRRNHLLPGARARLTSDPVLGDVDLLAEMRILYRKMRAHLNRAEAATDWPSLVAFHREARADLELLARLTERLGDGGTTVNINLDARVQSVILDALKDHSEARIAVAEALQGLE